MPAARAAQAGARGGGAITLATGTTWVAGAWQPSAGGQIRILGVRVALAGGATVDASGETEGGEVLVRGRH